MSCHVFFFNKDMQQDYHLDDPLELVFDGKWTYDVLFETDSNGIATGHTPSFIEVKVKSGRAMHAELALVRILSHDTERCEGVLIKK